MCSLYYSLLLLLAGFQSITMSNINPSPSIDLTLTSTSGDGDTKDRVLIFGGNGFIGSELVHSLIQTNKYSLYLVSRGNWYFDSAERIQPYVTHLPCDRENSDLDYCTQLMTVVQETERFKYVFDFSGYKPNVVAEALELLINKTELYVYISTDSVYEVCVNKAAENGGKSREVDAIRPDNEDERDVLNELDEYGHEKLEAEEIIVGQSTSEYPTNYLIVRLPDVFGPRDNTDRTWIYVMWLQFYEFIKVPIFIPPSVRNLKTSYVYVKDVVRAILHLIDKGVSNEIYNVGFEHQLTLEEFLNKLKPVVRPERFGPDGSKIVPNEIEYDYNESEKAFHLFPSVTRGGIDVSKLLATGFQPTDLITALQETVDFYMKAFFKHISERDDVVHQITRSILLKHRKGPFLQYIDAMTQVKSFDVRPKSEHTEL